MTTSMPAVRATAELYPEPDRDLRAMIDKIATTDRDAKGNYYLRRSLSIVEKQLLSRRLAALEPVLTAAKPSKVTEAISRMLTGFGASRVSEEEAEVIATQYTAMLRGLPLWAVERACYQFGSGQVTAADLGEKRFDRAFAPSSAQLRIVADKLARPMYLEASRVGMTLRGSVAQATMTPGEVAAALPRIKSMHDDFRRRMAEGSVEEAAAEKERREARARTTAETNRRMILEEYSRNGIEPVYADAGKTIPVGLAILRQRGYTIEDLGHGIRALIAPGKVA